MVLTITALFGVAAWRLSQGEISADFLRDSLVRGLEQQVPGSHGGVNHIGIVWFDQAKALGVQLDGVWLRDGQGRLVLRAAKVQAAVALDSLLVFAPAPGRIAAEDFFVAVSVSPAGRYELGYLAKGKPEAYTGLGKLFIEITSPTRRNWSASYLRDLDLRRGQLSLRQTDGGVSWTGDVRTLVFRKAEGLLQADCDLSIGSGPGRAELKAKARAAVGLKDAAVDAQVQNLNPAEVFPSAGLTRGLSALDARVGGRGSIAYGRRTGFQSADLAFSAGSGRVRFGKAVQPFDSAKVQASYNPQTGDVELDQVQLTAASLGLDLQGKIRLIPQGAGKAPARLDFNVTGPKASMVFAPGSEKQTLANIDLTGTYTPEAGRITIDRGRATLAGKAVEAKGHLVQALSREGLPEGRWGAKLEAKMIGTASADQAYPFWPSKVGSTARDWVKAALKKGQLSNVTLNLAIPPALGAGHLTNEMLQVGFDFDGVAIDVVQGLPLIEDGRGKALVQGDRFDLFLTSGRMQAVRLSEGLVSFPKFNPAADAIFQGRARGDAGDILSILNQKPLAVLNGTGFEPAAFAGDADVKFSITRPMHGKVASGDNRISFAGNINKASIQKVALGLDATDGVLSVSGGNLGLTVVGTAKAGPYAGNIDYRAQFSRDLVNNQTLALDGNIQSAFARVVPVTAQLAFGKAGGSGRFSSRPVSGDLAWKPGEQAQMQVNARFAAGGLSQLGLPVSSRGRAFQANLLLDLKDQAWHGPLKAEGFSADITYAPGLTDRLSLAGKLTPADATMLGLPSLPLFEQAQAFSVSAVQTAGGGSADYALGKLAGHVDWSAQRDGATEFRLKTDLSADDFAALGAPSLINPATPVSLAAQAVAGTKGVEVNMELAGLPIRLAMEKAAAGQGNLSFFANLSAETAARLGLFRPDEFSGNMGLSGLLRIQDQKLVTGRLEADLTSASLSPRDIGWSKSVGAAALVTADIASGADGALVFRRIAASGPGLEIQAQGWMNGRQALSFHSQTARIKGLFEGQLDIDQGDGALTLKTRGAFLDARRLIAANSIGQSSARSRPQTLGRVILDIDLDQVRVSDSGTLKDLKIKANLTGGADRTFEASVMTESGAPARLVIAPKESKSGLEASIDDVGALTSALFETDSVRGGQASLSGSFVEGGLDLTLKGSKLRVRNIPVLAQILTLGSLRGFADTLNGSGIEFADIVVPMRLRGSTLWIDDGRATGDAIGLTARGKIDLTNRSMDMVGGIAPAYALNSAIGHIPVLGALFISRQGEGVFGLTYSAKGSITAAKVFVNPFSLATPGMFRRIFDGVPIGKAVLEAPPPLVAPEQPAP